MTENTEIVLSDRLCAYRKPAMIKARSQVWIRSLVVLELKTTAIWRLSPSFGAASLKTGGEISLEE